MSNLAENSSQSLLGAKPAVRGRTSWAPVCGGRDEMEPSGNLKGGMHFATEVCHPNKPR